MTHHGQNRNVRVIIRYNRAPALQQLHDLECRRLAWVIDIFLVGHAKYANPAPLDRFFFVIEGVSDAVDDVLRHRGIDFAREFNEARMDAELARHPGQVKGVNGDAMTAQAGTGVKSLKPKGLGPGG